MDERRAFIERLRAGEKMTDLCREFGISRKTGYKFLERYERRGDVGLVDESRAPQVIPHKTPEDMVAMLKAARKKYGWGPKQLKAVLEAREPGLRLPAASTIGDILEREGLVQKRRMRRRRDDRGTALTTAGAPNDLWCIDFKGQFRLGNGRYCYPLTLTDQFSRFLLCCEAQDRIDGAQVREAMLDLFREHGMPLQIRSDNGSPFAGTGLLRLSKLSVWWMRLGIIPERITPGEPQENGRHERMHLTLKQETTRPAALTFLQQQERFDLFRATFNDVRPHEGLGQTPPRQHYRSSSRLLPQSPAEPTYPFHDVVQKVNGSGQVRIEGRKSGGTVFLSNALAGELVGLREVGHRLWLMTFIETDLGLYDAASRRFMPADHPQFEEEFKKLRSRGTKEVSPMNPV